MYIYIYVIIASCVRVESDRTCPAMSAAVGAGGGDVPCSLFGLLLFAVWRGRRTESSSRKHRIETMAAIEYARGKEKIDCPKRSEGNGGRVFGGGGGVVDWRPKKKQKQGEYDVESSEDDHRTTQNVLETRAHRRDCDRERDTKVVERK